MKEFSQDPVEISQLVDVQDSDSKSINPMQKSEPKSNKLKYSSRADDFQMRVKMTSDDFHTLG